MGIGHKATIAKAAGTPVSEFLLIPFGHVNVNRPLAGGSFTFTRRHAQTAVERFEANGRKLAIDYEHQSHDELNTRADGLSPAAGWIDRLAIRGDGLWAFGVQWTDKARSLLTAGEYRYFSPVIYWKGGDCGDIDSLGSPAITNDPAMEGVQPLVAMQKKGLAMFATVLAARPLPRGVFKLGGSETVQPGGKAEVIAAISDFAERVDWAAFQAAFDEMLVETVDSCFDDDDKRVLTWLGRIIDELRQGGSARDIVGGFMLETPDEGAAPGGGFTASRALRNEFGSAGAHAAYQRAERAGLVNLCAATRKALASRAASSPLVARKMAPEREWQSSAQTRSEFGEDKDAFLAYRRAERAGLVAIAGQPGR